MDNKSVIYIQIKFYSLIGKELNYEICRKMDEPEKYYTK